MEDLKDEANLPKIQKKLTRLIDSSDIAEKSSGSAVSSEDYHHPGTRVVSSQRSPVPLFEF